MSEIPRLNLNTVLEILLQLQDLYPRNPLKAQKILGQVIEYLKKVKEDG